MPPGIHRPPLSCHLTGESLVHVVGGTVEGRGRMTEGRAQMALALLEAVFNWGVVVAAAVVALLFVTSVLSI